MITGLEEVVLLEVELLNSSSSTWALFSRVQGSELMRKGEMSKEVG